MTEEYKNIRLQGKWGVVRVEYKKSGKQAGKTVIRLVKTSDGES